MQDAQVMVKTNGPSDPAWHAAHDGTIGGSRIASILGVGFGSPMRVYMEMTGQVPPVEDNERMYWGRMQEAMVASVWAERNGKKIKRVNAVLQSKKYPRFIASPDRLIVGEEAGLEVKCTSEYMRRKWSDGELPDNYEVQSRWYMMVTGLPKWYIAVLVGGNELVQFDITRDLEIEQMMIDRALEFLKLVDERTPPVPDGSTDCTDAIVQMYPTAVSASVLLPLELGDSLSRLKEIESHQKELEEEASVIKDKVRLELGEAEVGYLPGNTTTPAVTWKSSTTRRFDTNAFRAAHPDLANEFTKESLTRTLRFAKGV